MIPTPRIDPIQSIKESNGSLIILRKSQIDISLYKLLQKRKIIDSEPNANNDQSIQTSLLMKKENEKNDKSIRREDMLWLRWVVSFCDCWMQMSKFYCMDSAAALQTYFQNQMGLSGSEYNLFYSIFAYLFILPFVSGYLCDKLGVRTGLFMFVTVQTIGHIIFMFGGSAHSFHTMLLGRFLFGIGALCVEVCEDVMLTIWFFDKELTLALGLNFASCRIGTALTSMVTPSLMEYSGNFFHPLFAGTVLSIIGYIGCLVIVYVDSKYQSQIKHELADSFLNETSLVQHDMQFSSILKLGQMFWLIALNCLFAYIAYFAFSNNGNDLLVSLFSLTPSRAGFLLTIVYLVSGFFTPIFGLLIDRIGRRVQLMYISLVVLLLPHLLLLILPSSSFLLLLLSLFLLGFFFALYAAVFWSCIPLVVDSSLQGIAFGIVYSTLNVVLVIASGVMGFLQDVGGRSEEEGEMEGGIEQGKGGRRGGYEAGLVFMMICLGLALVTVEKIRRMDGSRGGALNSVITNTEIRERMKGGEEGEREGERLLDFIEEKKKEYLEMREIKENEEAS